MSITDHTVTIKRQTEVGSRNWGVYLKGKLLEGGFFSSAAAKQCAAQWQKELEDEKLGEFYVSNMRNRIGQKA